MVFRIGIKPYLLGFIDSRIIEVRASGVKPVMISGMLRLVRQFRISSWVALTPER